MTNDLIDHLLAAGDQSASYFHRPLGNCRWCDHDWHGVTCRSAECGCDSSLTARDDTWRPRLSSYAQAIRTLIVMHDTGADGWTARAAASISSTAVRLRTHLYGKPQR